MYISNLKIQGFKSFLNKTDLNFGPGITTIVGPNGCGKTNIVDAIRWILGEQKTSVLRSGKMEDVIFNGTKNRKAISMCEASMTIHNNRGMLPIEYNDVEIARRLFRSGESEYLLNKTPCRLKDIQDLFIDTGMSSNAYSVIELKMIDSILSQNADDRRRMFEEAAGINQYKKQRQSTFRKLESTMVDVERVKDIISEVDHTLRNLRLQLKRYERHKKLVSDLKSANILLAQIQIQELHGSAAPLHEKLKNSRDRQQSLAGQLNLDESLISKVNDNYDSLKSKLEKCQAELRKVERDLSTTNNNILVWTEQRKGAESKAQHYADEVLQSKGQKGSLEQQVTEIQQKIDELAPLIKERQQEFTAVQKTFTEIDGRFGKHQQKYTTQKAEYEGMNKAIFRSESLAERLSATIKEKENYLDRLNEQLTENKVQVHNYEADVNLFKAQITTQEKVNSDLAIDLENAQQSHSTQEGKLLTNEKEIAHSESLLNDLNNKLKFYEDIMESNAGRSSGVKLILENPDNYSGVLGVLGDLITVKKGYENAVESALSDLSGFLVVKNRSATHKIMDTVNREKAYISIIALDALKGVKTQKPTDTSLTTFINGDAPVLRALQLLLADVHITPSSESYETLSEKSKMSSIWITKDGQRFDRNLIYQSPKHQDGVSDVGRAATVKSLQSKQAGLVKNIQKLKAAHKKLKSAADSQFNTISTATAVLDTEMQKLIGLEKELSQREYIISQQGNTSRRIGDQITETQASITSLNIQKHDVKTDGEQAKADLLKIEATLKELTSEQETIQKERNRVQQQLQDVRVSVVEIEKENEGLEFRLNNTTTQILDLDTRISRFSDEIDTLSKQGKELTASIADAESEKEIFIVDQQRLSGSLSELEASFSDAHEELQTLQADIRDQQKIKEKQILEMQDVELKLAEMHKEEELIRGRIRENYKSEVPSDAVDSDDVDIDELRAQVESIDRSIERIGAINMAAQEEFEREEERYTFLKAQYDDLMDAEGTLKETIGQLDMEARDKFSKTYEQIKEFFKTTYTMFFDGGEAHLRLVGDDDPLEASIEIIAKPPGKKPQTLRMLSAGEKALTAIALLFAIYMVKPSPFCILDEVDAPLDDQNIGKFTHVLKQFAEKTQFIVVTHNKLTMEKADYLYGVTQKEEGVSQIVSVKFTGDEPLVLSSTS